MLRTHVPGNPLLLFRSFCDRSPKTPTFPSIFLHNLNPPVVLSSSSLSAAASAAPVVTVVAIAAGAPPPAVITAAPAVSSAAAWGCPGTGPRRIGCRPGSVPAGAASRRRTRPRQRAWAVNVGTVAVATRATCSRGPPPSATRSTAARRSEHRPDVRRGSARAATCQWRRRGDFATREHYRHVDYGAVELRLMHMCDGRLGVGLGEVEDVGSAAIHPGCTRWISRRA